METEELLRSRIFSVERLTFETAFGESMTRDVIRHPGSVAIVPLLDDGRICLIENRRVSVNEVLVEIPAGTMEPPEPAVECAHRELAEETGYRSSKMTKMTTFFPAPGILDEQMHLFLAKELSEGIPAREPGEQIENFVVTLAEAKAMILNGTIQDAKTIVGLLMLETMEFSR